MGKMVALEPVVATARGFAQAGVRIGNERSVLTLIGLNPGASNADLARLSGLGPQTTSRIVADLEGRGLVRRGEVLRGRRGQPATPLFIEPEGAFSIGVEIGWRHAEVQLFSMGGKTLASLRRSYAWPDTRAIIELVAAEIATIRAGMAPEHAERLAGIGIASPADFASIIPRLGASATDVERWRDFSLSERLERACGLPVQWFHDGNAACWSERIVHPAPRPAGMAYIQVGTLIASGIVVDGELWSGPGGGAADLGSILVPDASCRPTPVHLIASLLGLEQRLRDCGMAVPDGNPLNWDWAALEPVATGWLDEAGRAIAMAILNANAMLDLDGVVVDGVMPRPLVERLLESVRRHLDGLPRFSGDTPDLRMGRNGGFAAASGAAMLVLFHRYFSRGLDMFETSERA